MTQADILLIEDQEADAYLLQHILNQSAPDVTLLHISNGAEAWDQLRENIIPLPRLILLDLNLPGFSGKEILQFLRDHEPTKRIPIVVLSSSVRQVDVDHCHTLGANAYVVKPNDLEDIKVMLQSIVAFWLNTASLPDLR